MTNRKSVKNESKLENIFDNYNLPSVDIIEEIEIEYPEIDNPKKIRDDSWDFATANTKEFTHGFHSYPAMMIPQIARKLLDIYSIDSDIVLDPFCGSGSCLVESKIRGLNSYGIDINPLALLIARVKTTPIEIERLENCFNRIIKNYKNSDKVQIPEFFNIEYWFKENVIKKLAKLKKVVFDIKEKELREFFQVVFSETVRSVSNTRNSEFKLYRIPKKKLEKYNPDVIGTFNQNFTKNLRGMKAFLQSINKKKKAKVDVLDEDSRERTSLNNNSIDLLITSPPYGDSKTTVAYGQFSRLSLQWMGYNRKEIRTDKESLGGKTPSFNEKLKSNILKDILILITKEDKKRAMDVLNFFIDLQKCFNEFKRIMKNKSTLCFVLGNRTVKRIQIPTDEIIREMGENIGWNYERTIIRKIPSKKMPSKNSPSNVKGMKGSTMNNEYIVIFNNRG